jgi:hypothetical protein
MPGTTQSTSKIGAKLQKLIDAKCITKAGSKRLTEEQRNVIEDLETPEIKTLLEVRRKVGKVTGGGII